MQSDALVGRVAELGSLGGTRTPTNIFTFMNDTDTPWDLDGITEERDINEVHDRIQRHGWVLVRVRLERVATSDTEWVEKPIFIIGHLRPQSR